MEKTQVVYGRRNDEEPSLAQRIAERNNAPPYFFKTYQQNDRSKKSFPISPPFIFQILSNPRLYFPRRRHNQGTRN